MKNRQMIATTNRKQYVCWFRILNDLFWPHLRRNPWLSITPSVARCGAAAAMSLLDQAAGLAASNPTEQWQQNPFIIPLNPGWV